MKDGIKTLLIRAKIGLAALQQPEEDITDCLAKTSR